MSSTWCPQCKPMGLVYTCWHGACNDIRMAQSPFNQLGNSMNQTTKAMLQEIAQTGQAVVIISKARDAQAAHDLIKAGICHQSSTHDGYVIIKFGSHPANA